MFFRSPDSVGRKSNTKQEGVKGLLPLRNCPPKRAIPFSQPPEPGLPHHRRLLKEAQKAAEKEVSHLRVSVSGNEARGGEDAVAWTERLSARPTAKAGDRRPQEAEVRPRASADVENIWTR